MFVTHLITFLTIGSIVYGTFVILPIATYYVPSVTKTAYLLMRESSCCLHLTTIKRMLLKRSNILPDIKTITKRNKILSHYMGIMQLSVWLIIYSMTAYSYSFHFYYTAVGQASESTTSLALNFQIRVYA